MKFLLDEDLSPKVAEWLQNEDGVDVVHVRDRGLLSEPDHIVLQKAFSEDRILVTANVRDFQRLARASELHAGIVLGLHGSLTRTEQLAFMRKVISAVQLEVAEDRDMINRVLEIETDGEIEFYELPIPVEG